MSVIDIQTQILYYLGQPSLTDGNLIFRRTKIKKFGQIFPRNNYLINKNNNKKKTKTMKTTTKQVNKHKQHKYIRRQTNIIKQTYQHAKKYTNKQTKACFTTGL